MTPIDRENLRRVAEAAHRHICDLAQRKKEWRMSIPVQPDDSDMILQSPLDEIGRLLDRLEALERVASAARPFAPVNRLTDEDRIDNRDKLRRALAKLDGGVK